jgi:hypothetical protein
MPTVYCKKCGITGFSKCPHCRSIFADGMPMEMELLDNFIHVRDISPKDENGQPTRYTGGDHEGEIVVKHEVYFETYADTQDIAMERVLSSLQSLLSQHINIKVASCVHEWELAPGEVSSIGCGHVGPEAKVPSDPFAGWKKKHNRRCAQSA